MQRATFLLSVITSAAVGMALHTQAKAGGLYTCIAAYDTCEGCPAPAVSNPPPTGPWTVVWQGHPDYDDWCDSTFGRLVLNDGDGTDYCCPGS
jgi:hypothetical protein